MFTHLLIQQITTNALIKSMFTYLLIQQIKRNTLNKSMITHLFILYADATEIKYYEKSVKRMPEKSIEVLKILFSYNFLFLFNVQ